MSSANEIIVDSASGSRKDLASLDEPLVEFLLDTLMPPLLRAELCELDQGHDLSLEHGKIGSTSTGVKILLFIGMLSCAEAIPGFYQIYLPVYSLILSAPAPPRHRAAREPSPSPKTIRW
jgi:hypothetical protein